MDLSQAANSVALNGGGGTMILGGVIAQSPNPDFSTLGIVGVIGGLLTVAYPWYKITIETYASSRKIAELEQARIDDKAEHQAAVRMAKEEAATEVRDAKEEARQFMDATRLMVERLIPRVETAARAIDTTTTAVLKVAENANVSVAVAPKMNGGHGAMDMPPMPKVSGG